MYIKLLILLLALTLSAQALEWNRTLESASFDGRYGHTVVGDKSNELALLFGGYDGRRQLNDLYSWTQTSNTTNVTWTEVRTRLFPPTRSLHFACLLDGNMYIFGGRNDTAALNDLWRYNIRSSSWEKLRDAPRSGFDIAGVCGEIEGKRQLIIIGGRNETTDFENIMRYDIGDNSWTVVETTGPKRILWRSGHRALLTPDKRILIFGGFSLANNSFPREVLSLNIDRNEISVMETKGERQPSGRYGLAAALVEGQMVIMGGWDGTRYLNDLWILGQDGEWREVEVSGNKPPERALHASVVTGDGILNIIGGAVALDRGLNDMWSIDLSQEMRRQP